MPVSRALATSLCLSIAVGSLLVAQRPDGAICVTGARLLDPRVGRYLASAGVVIEEGRVAAIYPREADIPASAQRLDLPGTTIVPGLCDMHAAAGPTAMADTGFYYSMALAHGVTSYRVVEAPMPWAAGQRSRARSGEILAPRLWVSGPTLDPDATPGLAVRSVSDAASVSREVSAQAAHQPDFLRAGQGATPDIVRALAAAARAARIRTSVEPGATSAVELSRLGVAVIDRLAYLAVDYAEIERRLEGRADLAGSDPDARADAAWAVLTDAEIDSAAAAIGRRRTGVVALLAAHRSQLVGAALEKVPALAFLPARWRDELLRLRRPEAWPGEALARKAAAARGRAVAHLVKAGARVVTGTDARSEGYAIPGAGIHRELALLVAAGLTPAQAIRAATTDCGELLGARTTVGLVRVGGPADFIVVDGDPLQRIEDLGRIRLVVRGGEVLDPRELLAQARRATR